jgi:hypothetical protein
MTSFQTLFQRLNIGVVKLGDEIWIVLFIKKKYFRNTLAFIAFFATYFEEIVESLH